MENEPLAPSATNSLNKEVLVLKGPDGHEFSIKIPGAASQHVSVVDSPAHQEAIHHYNDVLATNPESSAIVNRVESSSFDRSVTEIGSLSLLAAGALVGALAMVRRKSSGHGGHGHGHGHSHYHGPKVPLLKRSRRYQINHIGKAFGSNDGKEISRTSDSRLDSIRRTMYNRITPDIASIPTKIVLVDEYRKRKTLNPVNGKLEVEINPITGEPVYEFVGQRREVVANSGSRGVERLTGRTGIKRSESSVTRDQETKAGQIVARRISFSETQAASPKEKRLEKRLARVNDELAKMQAEVDTFTKLYGGVLLDDRSLEAYIRETPMGKRERAGFLELAIKARHAQHVKKALIEEHYGDLDAARNHQIQDAYRNNATKLGLVDKQFKVNIDGISETGWHIEKVAIEPDPMNGWARTELYTLLGPSGERILVDKSKLLGWQ